MSKREKHPDKQVNPDVLQGDWLENALKFSASELRSARLKSGLAEPQFSFLAQVDARLSLKKKFDALVRKEWVFPVGLALEQSSSCSAATFKSTLISPKHTVDLCAGMGIDSWALSLKSTNHLAFEKNSDLAKLLSVNLPNAHVVGDSFQIDLLDQWIAEIGVQKQDLCIYLDPDRRVSGVPSFSLSDTVPNLPNIQSALLERANTVLSKHSPMASLAELQGLDHVRSICVVQDGGECKEIVVVQEVASTCVELELVDLKTKDRVKQTSEIGQVASSTEFLEYLIQPSAGLSKSGLHEQLARKFNWSKTPFGNLYTSTEAPQSSPFYRSYQVLSTSIGLKYKGERVPSAVEAIGTPFTSASFRRKYKLREGESHKIFVLQAGKTKRIVSSLKME